MIIEGAKPNVIKSAKLSSCFPISPLTLSNLAKKPSKKSRNAPKMMQVEAKVKLPPKAKRIAKIPNDKFPKVIRLGMCLNMLKKYDICYAIIQKMFRKLLLCLISALFLVLSWPPSVRSPCPRPSAHLSDAPPPSQAPPYAPHTASPSASRRARGAPARPASAPRILSSPPRAPPRAHRRCPCAASEQQVSKVALIARLAEFSAQYGSALDIFLRLCRSRCLLRRPKPSAPVAKFAITVPKKALATTVAAQTTKNKALGVFRDFSACAPVF